MSPAEQLGDRLDGFADQAFGAAAGAFTSTAGPWEDAVGSALAELFEFLAANPLRTREWATSNPSDTYTRFAEFLEPGFAEAQTPAPALVAEAVSGAVFELIRLHAIENRLDELPDAAPLAALIALTPFVGSERAELLTSPRAPTRARR